MTQSHKSAGLHEITQKEHYITIGNIYVLNRKNLESREIVEYEMVAAVDLPNVELPTRIATKKIFPAIGDFI